MPVKPRKSKSPTRKRRDKTLPASSMGAMSAQARASLSSIKMPSQLWPMAKANVDERAEAAFTAMDERRRLLRMAGDDAATEINGDSGIAKELAAWAKARAGREEATEARIEALHYAWTASLPASRPGSSSHRPGPHHAPPAPHGGGGGRCGSAAIAPARLRPTSAPIASRPGGDPTASRHRPTSAAARSYRREPTAWRLHVRDVSVIGISELLKSKREAPTTSAQKMGFGSSSMARSGMPTKPAGKPATSSPPGDLRVVVRALWSNETAMTAALPAAGSDQLAWRGVGVALSLPASGGSGSPAAGATHRPGSGRPGFACSDGLGGSWAQAGDETVSVELWEVRKRSDGGLEERQVASGTISMPIGGRAQAAYGGQVTVQLSCGPPALMPSREARAAGPTELDHNAPRLSFAWRAEGQTRREVEQGWSDGETREADLTEESQQSGSDSDESHEDEDEDEGTDTRAQGSGATASPRMRRPDLELASPGGADASDDEHPLAGLSMAGMGVAKVWDAEAGRWKGSDTHGQTEGSRDGGRAAAVAHVGSRGAAGGLPASWADPTVYSTPTKRRPHGGGEEGGGSLPAGVRYVTSLREGALGPDDHRARTPADGAGKPAAKPAASKPATAAGEPRAGGKGGAGGPAGLVEPWLDPEAARFRHRPASAPSARLLTEMDELSRIKAAFARQGMTVDMRRFERALLVPDDQPAELCLRALPRQGSRAMPLDRFLPAHLQPPQKLKPATRKKKKGGKKK